MSPGVYSLAELEKGVCARILSVDGAGDLTLRFMEMGLLEGANIEVIHEAPFSRDPIAVRVRGSLIALRRNEAGRIKVVVCASP